MSKFKPTIVLTAITTIIAALLIITHNLTYVDTSNMITDKLEAACAEAMGEGEFSIVPDWKAEGYAIEKPDTVEKLIKKSDGSIAFEIITDGYSKEGIDLLIAMNDDGTVKAISVVELGETPGVGTKINDGSFFTNFYNKSGPFTIVKNSPSKDGEIQGVTGATYSSKGAAEAADIAVDVYAQMTAG